MQFKFENWLDFFIFFIIIVKIIFIITAIGHLILSNTQTNSDLDNKVYYWKKRSEFIFTVSIAVLLIYHFNPRLSKKPISGETKILFFLFGWVLLITANWSLFIKEAPWYQKIVSILK